MQIVAVSYALLLASTALLCRWLPATVRPALLAVASLVFYALGSWRHALGIVGLMIAVWLLATWLRDAAEASPAKRRWVAGLGIAACVAALAFFKYASFLGDSFVSLVRVLSPARGAYLPPAASPDVAPAIPLGISFFTFEFIHVLVDAHRHALDPKTAVHTRPAVWTRLGDFTQFAAFSLFFPTLLAGPIKRYQQFQPVPRVQAGDVAWGLARILVGLFKKIALADSVAGIALRLSVPDQVTPLGLWLAMYAYAAQIYFDFSGYSDLAIGAGRLLGYRVPENFHWPYLATDLSSFWRRWHISLSSWIRDYLYIPLGGNRGSALRVALNVIVVMALCGLWHGPAWHFVIWGVWHGLGLAATQAFRRWRGQRASIEQPSRLWRVARGLLTFHFVCFGWLWFAAPSVRAALTGFSRMFLIGL